MTILESGWNLWVCTWLVGMVSRRWVRASGQNLWVWLECIGVVSGCCCEEVYRYPHNNYYFSVLKLFFWQQHPYFFVHFKNVFSFFYTCDNLFTRAVRLTAIRSLASLLLVTPRGVKGTRTPISVLDAPSTFPPALTNHRHN